MKNNHEEIFWEKILDDCKLNTTKNDTFFNKYIHKEFLENNVAEDFREHINNMAPNRQILQSKQLLRSSKLTSISFNYGSILAVINDGCKQSVTVSFMPIDHKTWSIFVEKCLDQAYCLDELLKGKIPQAIQNLITDPENLIFPSIEQISIRCSCPTMTKLCKHVLAVLLTIPAQIEEDHFAIFKLRQRNLASDLICKAAIECANSAYSKFDAKTLESILSISLVKDPIFS